MSKSKRHNYTEEFKKEAVKLITEQGYKVSEASRNLGIATSSLNRWKLEFGKSVSPSNGPNSSQSLHSEIVSLKKANKRLEMEREILKKAVAFFAKESE